MSQQDVDGGLVGGASLEAESFSNLVNSAWLHSFLSDSDEV
jgi:triosephosphate isomerase